MKIKSGMTCYYCGNEASSSEHVPPKCFFPKDRRDALIQVPACALHNEGTSKDDSYVLFIISSFIGNNAIGKTHSLDKGIKPVVRSEALQKVMSENSIGIFADSGDGLEATKMIKIDRDRFDAEIKKMAYALFYHSYGKQWGKELFIGTNSMLCEDGRIEELGELINETKGVISACGIEDSCPLKGSNPEVFKYRFIETDNPDEPILQMIFYEGFEVWVFVKK